MEINISIDNILGRCLRPINVLRRGWVGQEKWNVNGTNTNATCFQHAGDIFQTNGSSQEKNQRFVFFCYYKITQFHLIPSHNFIQYTYNPTSIIYLNRNICKFRFFQSIDIANG